MTNLEREKIASFLVLAAVSVLGAGFLACVYLVDKSGFDIKETPERKVVTVYCLGDESTPVYCKTVKEEYEDLTDNEYKGKYYE